MPNATSLPPLTPREFIAFVRAKLGEGYLLTKFHVDRRTLQRWVSDERYVGEEGTRKNPVEKFEEILRDLSERGHEMESIAIVGRLAAIVGCDLELPWSKEPDKQTVADECLDDYPALTRFHQAVRGTEGTDVVRHLRDMAVQEIRETFERYIRGDDRQ